MGAVYRAQDTRLNISVAIKEMTPQPGLDPQTLTQLHQQFQQEATVMAHLDHPHLVGVSDFFEEGSNVYLVMKLVEGENLTDRIAREGQLTETEVLVWAGQLLDALVYCHSQGVLHRDIKPQNIIIRPDGRAVLVDFGLVKLWDPNDPRTKTAMRGMGTPEYAPPEQYEIAAGHTDARSDIYGLGATLYHALSGQIPPTATMRIVDPENLISVRALAPGVSAETEAAVAQAIELRPAARFQSAQEMAAALRGIAPTPPKRKRTKTKVMPGARPAAPPRWRLPVWAWALGAMAVATLGVGTMLVLRDKKEQPSTIAYVTATPTATTAAQLQPQTPTPQPQPTYTAAPPTATPTTTPTPSVPEPAVAILPANAAQIAPLGHIKKDTLRVAWLPDGDTLGAVSSSRIYFFNAHTLEEVRTIRRADAGIDVTFKNLAVSPDGAILATGTGEGIICLWQVSDGTLLGVLEGHGEEKGVTGVAFSPDGKTLASSSFDETVRLWRVSDSTLLHTLEGHNRWVKSVAFSPDGTIVASGGDSFDSTIRLWRVSDGALVRVLEQRGHGSVTGLSFSSDGHTIASSWGDDAVRLWRASDGALLSTLEHTADVLSIAFSPDGSLLASGAYDGTVWLWSVSDRVPLFTFKGYFEGDDRIGHLSDVQSVAFSPDGKLLLSGAENIVLWGVAE